MQDQPYAEIRPIPKTSYPVELNTYQTVALTFVKGLERLVLQCLFSHVSPTLHLMQHPSVEDTVMTSLCTTYSNLGKLRIQFVDFSSAFICMQPYILCAKLQELH